MWKCHKCGKPVYFAERKQSLGYDWHPECLRCEECGKRLNPGLHAEHKGVPYCHVPCYGALFGPQLFGHGTRVESHKSFGVVKTPGRGGASGVGSGASNGPPLPRDHLESKLKVYNQFFDNKSHEIRSREVNDRLIFEGALRVYWGVQGVIHLKEDDDQRTVITVRKRNSCRYNSDADRSDDYYHEREVVDVNDTGIELSTSSIIDADSTDISETMSFDTCSLSEDITSSVSGNSSKNTSPEHSRSQTLPSKIETKNLDWDEIDDLLQVERKVDENGKMYRTMPSPLPSSTASASSQIHLLAVGNDDDVTENTTTTSTTESENCHTLTKDFDDKSTYRTLSEATDLTSEEYLTANSTLKNMDYDKFKQLTDEEYLNNSIHLQTTNDGTLKSNQPIDPSRINDSLKLYCDNIMSKSVSSIEPAALRICPSPQYQTLNNITGMKQFNNPNLCGLQKSGSAVSRMISSENENWLEQGLNRSKSGPNWYENSNLSDSDNCETLKPSTIRKNHEILNNNIELQIGKNMLLLKASAPPEEELATTPEMNTLMTGSTTSATSFTSLMSNSQSSTAFETTATTTTTTTTTTTNGALNNDSGEDNDETNNQNYQNLNGVVLRKYKTGSTAIKRRSGNKRSRAKLKRRCSINGHFYNRETSFFTPPRGSQMSVWVTSLVSTQDVINLLLEKYKVESRSENFALFIVRDNGEQKRLKDEDYPLVARIMLGPHEDVARLFLMDSHSTSEISCEVAQFLNLSIPECRSILDRYNDEMEREVQKIKERYSEMKHRIIQRMESLKVRL